MGLSTHVLDTSLGKPAAGLSVSLERKNASDVFEQVRQAQTDNDGRVKDLLGTPLETGVYRLIFETERYYALRSAQCFYPKVTIEFEIRSVAEHYHVPLLLSPFGYNTYRGS